MRAVRDWFRTLVSLHDTPHGIAAGFSLGVGLSLIPIPFVGMLTALAIAPLVRCNLVATYVGSAVVNPVTGPFIYFAELWVGLGLTGQPLPHWSELETLDTQQWWQLFTALVGPFFLGGLATMIGVALATYPLIWWGSARWHSRRANLAHRSMDKGAATDSEEPATAPFKGSTSRD